LFHLIHIGRCTGGFVTIGVTLRFDFVGIQWPNRSILHLLSPGVG
jgi:hypothetical protein